METKCPVCGQTKTVIQYVCDMCGALTMYSDYTRECEDTIYKQWMEDTATYTHNYDESEG